jgi:hypothetical protein
VCVFYFIFILNEGQEKVISVIFLLGVTIGVPSRCKMFSLSHNYYLRRRVHHHSLIKVQVDKASS